VGFFFVFECALDFCFGRGVGALLTWAGVLAGRGVGESSGNGVLAKGTASNGMRMIAALRTARPFLIAGSNRHCFTASTAASARSGRAFSIGVTDNGAPPASEITARNTTTPRTRAASAFSG